MNILAINSSNRKAKISLKTADKNLFFELEGGDFLLKEIENALIENNLSLNDIDSFAVVTGPGSFTGLRAGISFVKAFKFALGKKVVCVDNFELIDHNINYKPKSYYIALSSNKNDFYLQKIEGEDKTYSFSTVENLNEILLQTGEKVFCDKTEKECFVGLNNLEEVDVSNQSFIEIVEEKLSKNEVCDINEIRPLYIKKSQAEAELNQKIDESLSFLTTASAKDVFVLEQKCFSCPYSLESLESDLQNENRHQIFAFLGDELVAYVSFEEVLDELSLFRICVLPELREYKIATKLMQKMIDYFNENANLKKIFLEVSSKNEKAIKLYQKFNFKQISMRENYYEKNDDALIFCLEK